MNKLKSFLYILLRDHVTFGDVEGIIKNHVEITETQVTYEGDELSTYVDSLVRRLSPPPPRLPKDGDEITVASAVAVVKEGCRQALDEAATRRQPGKVGNYAHVTYVNPWPPRTFIVASPPGRRKYVKLLLKRLGYRNLDKIPTTDKQVPYDLGRGLPDHERENLLAIAPGIVLRDVL